MSKSARIILAVAAVLLLLIAAAAAVLESPALRTVVAERLAEASRREVRIAGLDVDWRWPPRLRLTDVYVGNAPWAGDAPLLTARRIELDVDPLPLLRGRLSLPRVHLVRPRANLVQRAEGPPNWRLGDPDQAGGGPALGSLGIEQGELSFRGPGTELVARVATDAGDGGLRAVGEGIRRGAPFRFDLAGPLPAELIGANGSQPLRGEIVSGETRARLDGRLAGLGRGEFRLDIAGPNPAELYPLLGLALPDLPPYRLRGSLSWRGGEFRFDDFSGSFGDSDLAGDLRVDTGGERPVVYATLRSRRLDFDDLFPTVGGAPSAAGTASAEQRRQAAGEAERPGVFPRRRISFERLNAVDARVRFTGEAVLAPRLPMEDLSLVAELDGGVLRLLPLDFGLGGGEVSSRLTLDGRGSPARGSLTLRLKRVNLGPLMADLGVAEDSFGAVGGQGELSFAGDSVDAAMAGLDGELELLMEGGRLDMFAVEVAGLDLGEAVIARLSPQQSVPLRCAYARLESEDGQARLARFFIDTDDTNFTGGGGVDLDRERLLLEFEAHPKDASLMSLSSPVRLQGPFDALEVEVLSGELVSRILLAAAAALIAPPAALLPLIEPGQGEQAGPGCRQVLAEADPKADPDQGRR